MTTFSTAHLAESNIFGKDHAPERDFYKNEGKLLNIYIFDYYITTIIIPLHSVYYCWPSPALFSL